MCILRFVLALVLAATSVALPRLVLAEGGQSNGVSPSVSARVNFSIKVPGFIRFRVGAAGATQDTIEFDFSADPTALADAVLNPGTALSGSGGDQTGGAVTVQLVSNVGNVQITAVTNGSSLSDGGTNTIPYTDITTTASGSLTPPALQSGDTTSTITATSGSISETDTWTYTYEPSSLPAAADYTGFVTYTAATP